MTARTLAIGDVHGCDTALAALLKLVAPTESDTVVFLGDLVDRGPGTKQVLDAVLALQERCRVIVIQGNHEEMMLNALNGLDRRLWFNFGGDETLESYGGSLQAVPRAHIQLMEAALSYWETPATIFVHANLQPGVPLPKQTGDWLRWTHLTGKERPFDPERRVVCGHTPQKDGYPLVFPGWVGIDTFAHGGGWLTCLDVGGNWVWQTSDFGQTREFPLGWRE
jgi:serine/threonine protein phosphatase 1